MLQAVSPELEEAEAKIAKIEVRSPCLSHTLTWK